MVATLTRVCEKRGKPRVIKVDNRSEFISKAMGKWAYENGGEIDFSRPGKPTDYAQSESFNGRFRQVCLNSHWVLVVCRRQVENRRLADVLQRRASLLHAEVEDTC